MTVLDALLVQLDQNPFEVALVFNKIKLTLLPPKKSLAYGMKMIIKSLKIDATI